MFCLSQSIEYCCRTMVRPALHFATVISLLTEGSFRCRQRIGSA
jgi:hypothetical protein